MYLQDRIEEQLNGADDEEYLEIDIDDTLDDAEVVEAVSHAVENIFGIVRLATMVCDIDVAAMYPSIIMALNVSRETKKCTIMGIDGYPMIWMVDKKDKTKKLVVDMYAVERVISGLTATNENAVAICHEFLGLPNYREMHEELMQATQNNTF
jgi:DNA polymerase elongation subunit (family B)